MIEKRNPMNLSAQVELRNRPGYVAASRCYYLMLQACFLFVLGAFWVSIFGCNLPVGLHSRWRLRYQGSEYVLLPERHPTLLSGPENSEQ